MSLSTLATLPGNWLLLPDPLSPTHCIYFFTPQANHTRNHTMTIKTRNFTLELNGYLFVRAFGHELFKTPGEKLVMGKTP